MPERAEKEDVQKAAGEMARQVALLVSPLVNFILDQPRSERDWTVEGAKLALDSIPRGRD